MTSPARRRRAAISACLPLAAVLLSALLVPAPSASAQSAQPTPGPTATPTSTPAPGGTSSPAPSPSPAPEPEPVRVGNADSGRTVHLVPGQDLVVELVAPTGEQWHGPASSGPLYLVDYREGPDRTTARLEALHSQAQAVTLEASTDRPCFHSGEPCAQGFSTWNLQVVVDTGPAISPSYPCMAMAMPSPAPGTVLVTEQDNGRKFTVEQGKAVQVYLGGCSDPYTVPSADGPLFRERASYAASGLNATTFRALGVGTTSSVTAWSDPACFHTEPACARPAELFSVGIEVVAARDDSCLRPTGLSLDRRTIVATGSARVTVQSAPHAPVDLYAYTRPATQFRLVRTGTTDANGLVAFDLRPPANTRLYAQQRGCSPGPQVVLNVATALTLAVERTGTRTYLFSGDSLPARAGGLVVSLYRVAADGREVLTAQVRADAATGEWQLVRRFTGTGRFGFVVRTGQDLQNAPGRSNLRPLLVH